MKLRFITSATAVLFGFAVFAQNIDTQKIDSFISHIENNDRAIGSLSVFKNGEEIYNRSFGQAALNGVPYNADTKYQIGSITKMITATLIFELIESGKLHLSDKLSAFYPQIPNSDKITIKNLLEHSGGLGDYVLKNDSIHWLTEKVCEHEIFEEIIRKGVSFEAGEKVSYSNSGYFLLRKIAEKLFAQNYAELVAEKIAKPLNLKNLESITKETENTFASYAYNEKWEKITDFEFSNVIGVGDIVSTTKELNTLLYNFFNHKFVTEASVEQMKPINQNRFGRGLMRFPFGDIVFYGHGGDTYGTHSVVAYNEKDGLGFSYSINGERFSHKDFANGIVSILYGKEYEFPDFNPTTNDGADEH